MVSRVLILKLLTGVLTFVMAVVLVGIPISYSLHTHHHEPEVCETDHVHTQHDPHATPEQTCELCAFYAYYAPKEAEYFPVFSFEVPAIPRSIHVDKLRVGTPCTAFILTRNGRAPPAREHLA